MRRSAVSIPFGNSWRKKPPKPLGVFSGVLRLAGGTACGGQGGSGGGGQGGIGGGGQVAAVGCGGRPVGFCDGGDGRLGAFFCSWIRSRR